MARERSVAFVRGREFDRIGLVSFAGEALTRVPITTDYQVLEQAILDLRVGELDDGTAVAFPAVPAADALAAGERVELAGVEVVADGDGLVAFGADGRPLVGHQAFWFAWSQFMPETLLWER